MSDHTANARKSYIISKTMRDQLLPVALQVNGVLDMLELAGVQLPSVLAERNSIPKTLQPRDTFGDEYSRDSIVYLEKYRREAMKVMLRHKDHSIMTSDPAHEEKFHALDTIVERIVPPDIQQVRML